MKRSTKPIQLAILAAFLWSPLSTSIAAPNDGPTVRRALELRGPDGRPKTGRNDQRLKRNPCAVAHRLAPKDPVLKKRLTKALAIIGTANQTCKALLKSLGAPKTPEKTARKSRAFVRGKKTQRRHRQGGPCHRATRYARAQSDPTALARLRDIKATLRKARSECRDVVAQTQAKDPASR